MVIFLNSKIDIQICNVKPIPEPNPIILANGVSEKVSRYYLYNNVKRFQCDRPVHKGMIDKDNEIKVGTHFFRTKFKFSNFFYNFRVCGLKE